MQGEKFTTYPLSISAILGLIKANDIAIPEIQRPFVWKNKQVRDLMDSLYKGYLLSDILFYGRILMSSSRMVQYQPARRFL